MIGFNKWYVLVILCVALGCAEKEIEYYPNGQVKFEVTLKNGNRDGQSFQYYETGEIQIKSNWKAGVKEGESISYFRNGQTHVKANYVKNKANGEVHIYDSLGNLIEKYIVKDDYRHGKYVEFYSNGYVRTEGEYHMDKAHGFGLEYYENGDLFRKYYYHEDSIVYFKGYDKEGFLYDCVLPIEIEKVAEGEIVIRLLYTEFDSARIGVIMGKLDERKQLRDSTEVLGSRGLSLKYTLNPQQDRVSGKLYEIKMPENVIEGEYYFEKNL